jgi:hypothetical protein
MITDVVVAIVMLVIVGALAIWVESNRRRRRAARAAEKKRRKLRDARELREGNTRSED